VAADGRQVNAARSASITLTLLLSACGGTNGPSTPVATVTLDPAAITIAVMQTAQFTATLRDAASNALLGRSVAWSAANPVATVTQGGLATGALPGRTTVTATSEGQSGTARLTITSGSSAANHALDFVQSYVNVPDNSSLRLGNNWTIEVWIFPRTPATGVPQDIVSKWDGTVASSYQLQLDGAGQLRVTTNDGVLQTLALSNGPLPANVWQHVAATFNVGTLKLYLNGTLDRTITGARVPLPSIQPLAFGREGDNPAFTFNGLIDEVRLWSVARSSGDLAATKDVRLLGTESGLVGYWPFDEGSGQVVTDRSGHGNNGELGMNTVPDSWDPTWSAGGAPVQ
jgi:Concanavalin A-like lectin/glucanases superfamily/Bacterial Ig-like domain (group 2)